MNRDEELYLRKFLQRRPFARIVLDGNHVLMAQEGRRVSPDQLEQTVRQGRLRRGKCRSIPDRPYDKICTYR